MNTVIISVGGSIIAPDEIDKQFLKRFRELVLAFPDKRFIIVTGGGKVCRRYQAVAQDFNSSHENLDWIGISATHLNAELMRTVLADIAYERIAPEPPTKVTFSRVLVGCGYTPGNSSDYYMVRFAEQYNATCIINMSNIDYVYDKNPKEFSDAKRLEKMTWVELQTLVGTEWKPGLNVPFDPIATKKAAELQLQLVILGNDTENLKNYLLGKEFKGTVVEG